MQIVSTLKQTGAFIRRAYEELPDVFSAEKGQKLEQVGKIIVSIDIGGTEVEFDGDETSQNRLARAYLVLTGKNLENTPWKTYNNAWVTLSKDDILEILYKAGAKQTELWA